MIFGLFSSFFLDSVYDVIPSLIHEIVLRLRIRRHKFGHVDLPITHNAKRKHGRKEKWKKTCEMKRK